MIPLLCKEGIIPSPLVGEGQGEGNRSPSPLLSHQGRGEVVYINWIDLPHLSSPRHKASAGKLTKGRKFI